MNQPSSGSGEALILNLWHLKARNGMFYYALDYARSLGTPVFVVASPHLEFGAEFEPQKIWRAGVLRYICMLPRLLRSGAVFTPTPHPLPFISRQMIVVHDSYPFVGFFGRVKSIMLRLSLATSRCKVAFINRTDSRRFVDRVGGESSRKGFLPNHLPASVPVTRRQRIPHQLIVGLVGTDSPKKNYDELMQVVMAEGAVGLKFVVYGTDTAYFRQLVERFPGISIVLLPSSESDFARFFAAIDCLVSVATNEGFARPIAGALQCGVPCLLRENEVFLEFYDGAASFYPTISALVADLRPDIKFSPGRGIKDASELHAAIDSGVAALRELRRQT